MFGIKNKIKLLLCKARWAKVHPGNQLVPGNVFPDDLVEVGIESYGVLNIDWNGVQSKISIGNYCSIAPNVWFVINSEHSISTPSTYPFKVKVLNNPIPEAGTKGGIVVEDDVWVGYGATILDGVTLHKGCIVGAGAVVTKDVDPYSIVGGVPARKIRMRFDEDVVSVMNSFDWSKVDDEFIKENIGLLYSECTLESARLLCERLVTYSTKNELQ